MRLGVKLRCFPAAERCALFVFRESAGPDRIAFNSVQSPRNERRQNANGRTSMLKGSLCLAALASLFMSGAAFAQEKIKVGVTATLEGTYTVLGEDGIRGFQTALKKYGTKVGGKELEFIIASTTPRRTRRCVRRENWSNRTRCS